MADWFMKLPGTESTLERTELLLTREWLVANGLGGYAGRNHRRVWRRAAITAC